MTVPQSGPNNGATSSPRVLTDESLRKYLTEMHELHSKANSHEIMLLATKIMREACSVDTHAQILLVLNNFLSSQASIFMNYPRKVLSILTDILNILIKLKLHSRKFENWSLIFVKLTKTLQAYGSTEVVSHMMSILEVYWRRQEVLYNMAASVSSTAATSTTTTGPPDQRNLEALSSAVNDTETSIQFPLWNRLYQELCENTEQDGDAMDTNASSSHSTPHSISIPMAKFQFFRLILTKLCADITRDVKPAHAFITNLDTPYISILAAQMKYDNKLIKFQTLRMLRNMISSEGGVASNTERHIKHLLFTLLEAGMQKRTWPEYRDKNFDDLLSELLVAVPSNLRHYDHDSGIFPHTILSTFQWNIQNSSSERFKKTLSSALYDITAQGGYTAANLISLFECLSDRDIKDTMIQIYKNLLKRFHVDQQSAGVVSRKRTANQAFPSHHGTSPVQHSKRTSLNESNNSNLSTISDHPSPQPLKRRKVSSTGSSLSMKILQQTSTQQDRLTAFFGEHFDFDHQIQEFSRLQKLIESKQFSLEFIEPLLHVFQDYPSTVVYSLLVDGLEEHINTQSTHLDRNYESDSVKSNLIISCVKIISAHWENLSAGCRKNIVGYLEKILHYHQLEVLPLLVSLPREVGSSKLNIRTILISNLSNLSDVNLLMTTLDCIPVYARYSDPLIIDQFHPVMKQLIHYKGESSEEILFKLVDCHYQLLQTIWTISTASQYDFNMDQNFTPLLPFFTHKNHHIRASMIKILKLLLEHCPIPKLQASLDTLVDAFHLLRSAETHDEIDQLFSFVLSSDRTEKIFGSNFILPLIKFYIEPTTDQKGNPEEYIDLLSVIAHKVSDLPLQTILFFFLDCMGDTQLNTQVFDRIMSIAASREKQLPNELFTGDLHDAFFEDWLPQRIIDRGELIKVVVKAIFDTDLEKFIRDWYYSIVSPLIAKEDHKTLGFIANIIGKNVAEMCQGSFRNSLSVIVSYLAVKSKTQERFEAMIEILKREIVDKNNLLQNAIKYSIFHVVKRAGRVKSVEERQYLKEVITFIENCFRKAPLSFDKDPLKDQFFEITDNLFSSEMSHRSTKQVSRRALYSFQFLMELLGDRTVSLAQKIVSTLRASSKKKELAADILETYYLFLRLTKEAAGDYLRDIFVSIIPFLEKHEKIANKILHYLIIEQYDWTKHHFENLPELPQTASFEPFRAKIAEHVGVIKLEKRLMLITDMMRDQTLPVQCFALKQLKNLLQKHYLEIRDLVLSGKDRVLSSDQKPLFSDIMTELLKAVRFVASDRKASLDAAECLGLLGAIDPSYLYDVTVHKDRFRRVSDEELLNILIKKCHIYLTGDLHDVAAYSIQEYLRILSGLNPRFKYTGDEADRRLFEQLEPYQTTRFGIQDVGKQTYSVPVFRESELASVWLKHWANVIIHNLNAERPRDSRLAILEKSYNMMRDDDIALFVMTHLIDHAILHSISVSDITSEINYVLDHCIARPDRVEATKGHVGYIFQLLDNLHQLSNDPSAARGKPTKMEDFFAAISKQKLSEVAHLNKAYARAYMYLEDHLKAIHLEPKYSQPRVGHLKIDFTLNSDEWRRLIDLYRHLDESDGFYGFSSLNDFQLEVSDQLLLYKGQAEWNRALDCYEQALASPASDADATEMTEGVLECMRNLGHLRIMKNTVEASATRGKSVQCYGVQAAWRLNDWDAVDNYMDNVRNPPVQQQFECHLAKCLKSFAQDNDYLYFKSCLRESRRAILPSLRVACAESYTRAYPYLVQLQMLSEVDRVFSLIHNDSNDSMTDSEHHRSGVLTLLNQGLNITKDAVPIKEQLLSLRRVIFSKLNMPQEIGNSWVKWAKVCRKATHYNTAHAAILQATSYPSTKCFIEKAKLYWEMGQQMKAIKEVESRVSERTFTQADINSLQRKMQLLAVLWKEKTRHQTASDTIKSYQDLLSSNEHGSDFEDAQFHFALFLDQFLQKRLESVRRDISSQHDRVMRGQDKTTILAEIRAYLEPLDDEYGASKTVEVYAKSLSSGNKNMFHAMPRMLAVFFDTVEKCLSHIETLQSLKSKSTKSLESTASNIIENICNKVQCGVDTIAPFKWYSFLDQINNELRQQNTHVRNVVKDILTKLMVTFPEQTIWHLMFDLNMARDTKNPDNFMEHVLMDAATEDKAARVATVKNSATKFYEKFSRFARDYSSRESNVEAKLQKPFESFRRMLKQSHLKLIVPTHDFLYIPQGSVISETDPFRKPPLMVGVAQTFTVMSSQAKPRKIVFHGSLHGQKGDYPFLVKPRDDLRKDQRVMHFFSMLNRLIQNDPDSKRRKLKLNTFSCLPLAPNQGLVEWVMGTTVLSEKVHEQYEKDYHQKVVMKYYTRRGHNYETTVQKFENNIQPAYPPRFSRFFSMNFTDPAKWFEARLNFCRSCATYSMVGALIGLGDRHLENILLLNTGEILHIDFDCLFEKGKKLAIAEQVPFRLTANLIDGMGINQFEGVFRRTATAVLSLMRKNRESITTIFRAFINDFAKMEKKNSRQRDYHKTDSALFDAHFTRIEGMLDGFTYAYDSTLKDIRKTSELPLSVSGQVDRLISQATSTKRLCNMYVWWLPFV